MAEIVPVYRVTAGAEIYSPSKSASLEYIVYRVNRGPLFGQCGVVDTGSNFAAGVIDIGGKFATGVVDTGGAP